MVIVYDFWVALYAVNSLIDRFVLAPSVFHIFPIEHTNGIKFKDLNCWDWHALSVWSKLDPHFICRACLCTHGVELLMLFHCELLEYMPGLPQASKPGSIKCTRKVHGKAEGKSFWQDASRLHKSSPQNFSQLRWELFISGTLHSTMANWFQKIWNKRCWPWRKRDNYRHLISF